MLLEMFGGVAATFWFYATLVTLVRAYMLLMVVT